MTLLLLSSSVVPETSTQKCQPVFGVLILLEKTKRLKWSLLSGQNSQKLFPTSMSLWANGGSSSGWGDAHWCTIIRNGRQKPTDNTSARFGNSDDHLSSSSSVKKVTIGFGILLSGLPSTTTPFFHIGTFSTSLTHFHNSTSAMSANYEYTTAAKHNVTNAYYGMTVIHTTHKLMEDLTRMASDYIVHETTGIDLAHRAYVDSQCQSHD